MKLEHYSKHPNLDVIDPKYHGSGVRGEESKRKVEPNWQDRSYHYVEGTKPEASVGSLPHKYSSEVQDEKIYDYDNDPKNLKSRSKWGQSLDRNLYEKNIKEAGYHGFINRAAHGGGMGTVVALFHPIKAQSVMKKSSDLKKGSAQRRMKFNPHKVPTEDREILHAWTTYGKGEHSADDYSQNPQEAREDLPEMGPAERMRAISRLIKLSIVRKNKKTKEHEILLHRGISHDEKSERKSRSAYESPREKTSWSPKKNTAKGFADPKYADPDIENSDGFYDYDEDEFGYRPPAYGGVGGTVSAWVPLKSIHNIPRQYGNVDEPDEKPTGKLDTQYEHEVVVKPGKYTLHRPSKTKPKPVLKSESNMSEDLEKGKNAKEEKARIFGTDANAPRMSPRRRKMMQLLRAFAKKKYDLDMVTASGKRTAAGKLREQKGAEKQPFDVYSKKGHTKEVARRADLKEINAKREKKGQKPIKRVDPKPDWRSGQLETQPSPDAAVHEIAHLIHEKEGQDLPEMQRRMDESWGDSQKKYGHMQQKKTEGEIQPQALENPIRRRIGLPANKAYKNARPMEEHDRAVEQAIDESGPRFVRGIRPGKSGKPDKSVDYDRQSRLLTPELRTKLDQIDRGETVFDKETGWVQGTSPNAKINIRAREASKDPTRKDAETLMRSDDNQSGMSKLLNHLRMRKSGKWPVSGEVPPSNKKSVG